LTGNIFPESQAPGRYGCFPSGFTISLGSREDPGIYHVPFDNGGDGFPNWYRASVDDFKIFNLNPLRMSDLNMGRGMKSHPLLFAILLFSCLSANLNLEGKA